MLISKLRTRVEQSNISTEDNQKLMSALTRIEKAAFSPEGKLKITKLNLGKIMNTFSTELNKAIIAWRDLEDQYKTFQPRIEAAITKINIKVLHASTGISADMHRNILKVKARVRQAYNLVTDAMRTSKSILTAIAGMVQLESALAKCRI